ncbi:endonuclease VII domain-containing protein [Streptomyces sp. NPDC058252]|uniref:endonuclease VII domain-containing protein n=1 Tax=Streptomyces sp. NPDC058252 TaxID=3346405 RepID=UPI0036EE90C6
MSASKTCKDCGPGSKRPAPNPGPRCATHWRDEKNRRKQAAHEKRVQNVYGLGDGDYDVIYKGQGGKCAICQRATGATRKLSVDHNHKTGEVRGLLCRTCNNLLGHARDNTEFFDRAKQYLTNPPAREILEKKQWDGAAEARSSTKRRTH